MPTLWTYPWTLYREGLNAACEGLADRGVDGLNLASHYHSVRTLQPRFPGHLFESYPGGCYFDPDPERFADTAIDPLPNDVAGTADPLDEIVDVASNHGLDVNAWTVCLHNTRLGAENPAYRVESAFGDAHDHAFCPSNPDVREYLSRIVGAAADRGVNEVQLESVGFPTAFHDHGWSFGHDKRQVLTGDSEAVLLSQCFCDGCRAAAADHPVDLDAARDLVQSLLADSFARPHSDPPALDALAAEYGTLRSLFDFRTAVVTDLLAGLADAAGSTPLNYYVMEQLGSEPGSGWPSGVVLGRLADHVDRFTALCYVDDPNAARDRIRTLQRVVDAPVDVGLTLDPDLVDGPDPLAALADVADAETDGKALVYNHSLLTDAQLDWIESAFAA